MATDNSAVLLHLHVRHHLGFHGVMMVVTKSRSCRRGVGRFHLCLRQYSSNSMQSRKSATQSRRCV